MKKVWNFIYKYRIVIALVFLLIIGVFGFITVKQYLYPDDKLTVYGNRLDGIDKVKITDEKKNEIIKMIKEKAGIKDAKIDIQGKIINVSITASEKENTKEEMQKFMIGRDLDNKTITIPVFYEDGVLAGIIGRYISKNRKKNQRYKIYDEFERSKVLYPLNKSKPIKGVVILVEGQFDAIRMHRAGHTNTYATMTNVLSKDQAEWLCANCDCVIWIGDNDDRGLEGRYKAQKMLKNKVTFKIVDYPDYGKDVCDWTDEDIDDMVNNAHSVINRKLRRL